MLKYVLVLLCSVSFLWPDQLKAQALNTRINLVVKERSIKEVLEIIEKQTSLRFSYSDDIVPVSRKVTLNLRNTPLNEALLQIFANTFIDFRENGNQILLFRKKLQLDPKKSFTVSGFIREAGSGEALIGVNIHRRGTTHGSTTNAYGFFSLTLPSDTFQLVISYVGFESEMLFILLDRDIELNVNLRPNIELKEFVVEARRKDSLPAPQALGSIEVSVQQVRDIPALMGEKDVFKVIKLMPGVHSGTEGQSGLYVRGGGPDQNLVILDDATVYNAFHLFGFFSLFNGDALRSVELIKGGFPARYGGRLSSVLDIHMKDGNKEKIHGEGGIGIISSRLTLEGPLVKNKSSFLISGRRTYSELLTSVIMPPTVDLGYYFYDINAKADWVFSDKDKILLSFYNGRDRFYLNEGNERYATNGGLTWQNVTTTLRWNHVVSGKLFVNTSLIFSDYRLDLVTGATYDYKAYLMRLNSGIRDMGLKADFDYVPDARHAIKFGLQTTYHHFTPRSIYESNEFNGTVTTGKETYASQESSLYLEDVYSFTSRFKSESGIRFTHFYAQGKNYVRAEPRLSLQYDLTRRSSVKASYTLMNQFIHLLSNTGIGLPTDLWLPSTKNVGPQQAQQVALGFLQHLPALKTTVTLEGYYKKAKGVIGYRDGASFYDIGSPGGTGKVDWEQNVTQGESWSYGAELLVNKKYGRFSGWLGYTLSWTYMQFAEINGGKKFFARYDRRHNFSAVGIYEVGKKFTLSATWVYGTGNAISLPVAEFFAIQHNPQVTNPLAISGLTVNEYGGRNQFRMSPYHRLDIGLQYTKKRKHFENTWELSFYNAYNRKNPYFYYVTTTSSGERKLKQISMFPILPSISYSFRF